MKQYVIYKRSLQVVLTINALFIVWGTIAMVKYLQAHDISAAELAAVGVGTLVFGVLLPGYLIYRAEKKIQEVRHHVQQSLAKLIGVWAESYKNFNGEVYQNPVFWTNMGLLAVEEFGQDSDHPFMKILLEFSPYIRKEIQRQTKHSKASRAV